MREFKLPWREANPPNHRDDKLDPDQEVVNKELSLQTGVHRRRIAIWSDSDSFAYSGVTLNVARPDMNNYATLGVMLY